MKRFGVMLDMSRNGVMKPDEVKQFARIVKSFGYNMIQLYTEDTYEVEDEPYFGYMRGRYTAAELKDIVEYCNGIGMEAIPCIQTLAHLNQIFRWEEYSCINDTADILLAEDDRTYKLIENMFKTLRKVFTSEYIHIGMDEAHMLGLGKYLDQHGVVNRFDIINKHLKRVVEIAEKYNFKPLMWSDMFFRLFNCGNFSSENPTLPQEITELVPKQVALNYWNYYNDDKLTYDRMLEAHKKFKNEIWFTGGAWTWTGFAPGNQRSLSSMLPAMLSAKEHGIENIFIAMWGDNGKECSYYSVLPALFAIRKFYDGETDIEIIKTEFEKTVEESFDAMMALDCPNYISGNRNGNVCKNMLYNDPFFGVMDATVCEGAGEQYKKYKSLLSGYAKTSKSYGYIFDCEAALCDLLSVKYDLGARTRKAYQANNKEELKRICKDFSLAIEKTEAFYEKFSLLWYKENKPHGFDVQDIRIGGLLQRLKVCQKRLKAYLDGTIDSLPELEETLLDLSGPDKGNNTELPFLNNWIINATVNAL